MRHLSGCRPTGGGGCGVKGQAVPFLRHSLLDILLILPLFLEGPFEKRRAEAKSGKNASPPSLKKNGQPEGCPKNYCIWSTLRSNISRDSDFKHGTALRRSITILGSRPRSAPCTICICNHESDICSRCRRILKTRDRGTLNCHFEVCDITSNRSISTIIIDHICPVDVTWIAIVFQPSLYFILTILSPVRR